MASLLRSVKVPTKLVVGYSGSAYHAWISGSIEETGWVDNIIQFDGVNWSLMDPTIASSNDKSSAKEPCGRREQWHSKIYRVDGGQDV